MDADAYRKAMAENDLELWKGIRSRHGTASAFVVQRWYQIRATVAKTQAQGMGRRKTDGQWDWDVGCGMMSNDGDAANNGIMMYGQCTVQSKDMQATAHKYGVVAQAILQQPCKL